MKRCCAALWIGAFAFLVACTGTTGGEIVRFRAVARGAEAASDGTLEFSNSVGYQVRLERAQLHVGAVYLNQTVPSSGSQGTACTLPGVYVAEVLGGLDIDALSTREQAFPEAGEAIGVAAAAGELWLSGGAIDAPDDDQLIVDTAGSASRNGETFPFEAQLTIGRNRAIAAGDPAYPGANPICKQRIVSPIALELTPEEGGSLLLRVDPRGWFRSVDFATLLKASDDPLLYRFADAPTTAADVSLFAGLRSRSPGTYQLIWRSSR